MASTDNKEQLKQPAVIEWKHIDKSKFYTLAPIAGLTTRVVLYPTSLIKTRLQVQHYNALYNGTSDAFRKIVKFEGFRGLYKGFMINTIGVAAGQLYITSYERIKAYLVPSVKSEVARNLVGGFFASIISQTIIVPVNVVSQRQMVYGQTIDASVKRLPALRASTLIRQIYSSQGVGGFYKGYWASIIAFAPSSAIWWAAYGAFRRYQSGYTTVEQGATTMLYQAAGGCAAGVVTALTTNPLDVIRARLQIEVKMNDGRGWSSIASELWKQEGIRGLFKGASARMIYMGANSLFIITAYETVKRLSLRSDALLLDACADG